MNTKVINILGGPCTGKSTVSAELYAFLKKQNISCEMALEYAKDKVWAESLEVLEDQIYVFGHQHHRIFRLLGKVEVVICDSPLLLSIIYDKEQRKVLKELVLFEHFKTNSLNIMLKRATKFEEKGRYHTLEQSKEIDNNIKRMLNEDKIDFFECYNEEVCSLVWNELR